LPIFRLNCLGIESLDPEIDFSKSGEMGMIDQIRSCFHLGSALTSVLASLMLCGHLGALDDPGKDEEARREQQLKNMKRSAAQYAVSPADDRKRLFKFHETAAMRFSNPVGGTKDGTVYLWSEHGRPQAIIKLYTYDNEHFSHEWQSLSESTIIAERDGKSVWNPTAPGINYRELPDAPKPAESAVERLRQMKSLAGKFNSTYTPLPGDTKPVELRLLIQPLLRYEASDEPKCLDGALFGFAQGTAPLGLLLLEARKNGESQHWYYAFARLASGAITTRYGEKEVFSVERYDFAQDPKQTFLMLNRQPVPQE
jgi:hypothetical protein